MGDNLQQLLKIPYERLDEINNVLLDPDMRVISEFLEVVAKYGTPEEINQKAEQARQLPNLLNKVKKCGIHFHSGTIHDAHSEVG